LKTRISFLLLFSLSIFIIQCDDGNNDFIRRDYTTVPAPFSIEGATKDTTESGVIYYDIQEGSGELAIQTRDDVSFHFTAWQRNITTIDNIIGSTYEDGSTETTGFVSIFNFQVVDTRFTTIGSNKLRINTPYMAEGVVGMKEGGKRVLIFPPEFNNSGDTIRVDFELVEIAY
jgi:hypothetical protein